VIASDDEELSDTQENETELEYFKEGLIKKKSSRMLSRWKVKYCRVGNSQFMLYNPRRKLLSYLLDFQRITPKVEYNIGLLSFRLGIKKSNTKYKTVTLKARNKKDLIGWLRTIRFNVEITQDINKLQPTINYYWKVLYIIILSLDSSLLKIS
jgi:hypothetical protein